MARESDSIIWSVLHAPRCLIGATGFIGSNLATQTGFDALTSSVDTHALSGRSYDLVVCAGAPAAKWIANANPDADRKNLETLVDSMSTIRAARFVLISTIDVFGAPVDVTEDDDPEAVAATDYGRNRRWLERQILSFEVPVHVVRLPAVFGRGLKKNFLRDLLDGTERQFPQHPESRFQWYDVTRLWDDLTKVIAAHLHLVHLAVPPITSGALATRLFGRDLTESEATQVTYHFQTNYGEHWGRNDGYVYDEPEAWRRLHAFVAGARAST